MIEIEEDEGVVATSTNALTKEEQDDVLAALYEATTAIVSLLERKRARNRIRARRHLKRLPKYAIRNTVRKAFQLPKWTTSQMVHFTKQRELIAQVLGDIDFSIATTNNKRSNS